MVNVNEILTEYLEHKFGDRKSDFWDREIGTYHATDTGKCLRQIYYEFELGHRERPQSYPHFLLGNLIERYVEKALAHHYGRDKIKNSFRVKLDFDDFKIKGQTDPVLLSANAKPEKLFEVKSIKQVKFRRDEPSKNHVMQVHPYMRALNLNSCTIIYVQKTDLNVVCHVVPFKKSTFQRGINRLERLHGALINQKIPEPEPFEGWECRFCPYKRECLASSTHTGSI